jgi:intracellular septation protein A
MTQGTDSNNTPDNAATPANPSVDTPKKPEPTKKAPGGFLGNLAFNIIIPVVILSRFSGEESLGPAWAIVVALAFPVGYGLWDLKDTGKINPFSILGIISVMLTGGMSLLQLDPQYIAIKEAAIPGIIGLAVLGSQYTKFPLVKTLILNGQMIRVDDLYAALAARGNTAAFTRRMAQASYIVAASFFLSSALNYILARIILVSPPGTAEFNAELGRMTALSYPVIAIPSMIVLMIAIWFVFSSIKRLTGHGLETFLVDQG